MRTTQVKSLCQGLNIYIHIHINILTKKKNKYGRNDWNAVIFDCMFHIPAAKDLK